MGLWCPIVPPPPPHILVNPGYATDLRHNNNNTCHHILEGSTATFLAIPWISRSGHHPRVSWTLMHAICTNLACHWGPDVRRSSQVLKLDQVKRLRQFFCWTNNTQEFSSDTIVPYQFAISYLVVLSQEVPKSQPCMEGSLLLPQKSRASGCCL